MIGIRGNYNKIEKLNTHHRIIKIKLKTFVLNGFKNIPGRFWKKRKG